MPPIVPTGGVDEREPTLISDDSLQDVDGAEYRVGQPGLYVTRGRDLRGTISGVTGRGLYDAGFDEGDHLVVHAADTLYAAPVAAALTFVSSDTLVTGSSQIVGTCYANRHYVAFGSCNRRIEYSTVGVSSFPIGMSRSTLSVGTSITQGAGSMSATTGLVYWVTEYDSVRGIESMTGASASTGAFSLKDSVIVTATGTSANPRADQIRWYRSVDGGGFPDGGLIQTTAIGTTSITDTDIATGSLAPIQYGIVSVGGLDVERDEPPPAMSIIFGPFQDSLLGIPSAEPRILRFTPAGFPDSWPSAYAIPLETSRKDYVQAGIVLPGRIGLFSNDSTHVVYRLPRDSDSIFAAGEMQEIITPERGSVSRRGATVFTPPGSSGLAAWVARDGIWAGNLASSPSPITDRIDWEGRVAIDQLASCRLMDDTINRRLIFLYRRLTDTIHNTGVWYLDYQQFEERGIRITFADHGPLADIQTVAWVDGSRRAVSIDSRSGNGQVYLEATQDVDDSQFLDSSGSVRFRMRTKEFLPAGARGTIALGQATWMHDAAPARVEHRFYLDRRDSNPEVKTLPGTTSRNASDIVLGREVNSFSLEIESTGTQSYGVHWVDIEGLEVGPLGGRKGA